MSGDRIFTGRIPVLGDPRQGDEPRAEPSPLFLLSDSQLLFWADGDGQHFIDRIAAYTGPGAPRAAYLGASNGDVPDFYSIFLAAIEGIGPSECRMIPAVPSDEDRAFVDRADVILLAGGDVDVGWRAFEASGMRDVVERRYQEGAVLVGVSAGAVQLGTAGWPAGEPDAAFGTWGLAPFVVDAHAEEGDWAELRAVVRARGEGARGLGIPRGGGLVYHADGTLEAVRHPLAELVMRAEGVASAVIFPPAEAER
ncbi:Type 1 glutamine amidotransferase-like domain-containing protein [Longimicrobium sp.]|uniref:Type 1 glutamine amidotransferase-like domain-containing protein n=1 Tax=Longimicrobium sp. TaxID=2029185 RepID=UPI002E3019DC|nr:Type 1 glutamine amidotransferase-like domain-containing protein [Longimicrobium sp.]HEX6038361.1 Type 1 glutamine amidotransferase-like domain-containing protein [Longimicrobium sp.]